jgi:hypothetical protein
MSAASELQAALGQAGYRQHEADALLLRYSEEIRPAPVAAAEAAPAPRLARYVTRVHATNRHAGYGVPVDVLAASREAAVTRAIDLGWNGRRDDAVVTIDRIEDLP